MATDKKSFLLYCDLIHTVEKMPNDKAGELFKHILEYVNDKNPISDDLITNLTFEPIKQSLKRDLVKYEKIRERNTVNIGKRWNTKNTTGKTGIPKRTKNTDSDSVSVREINNKKVSFSNCLIFDKNEFKKEFPDWNTKKLQYYYDAALSYSNEGNKYIDWKSAVSNWAKRDELQGKIRFVVHTNNHDTDGLL